MGCGRHQPKKITRNGLRLEAEWKETSINDQDKKLVINAEIVIEIFKVRNEYCIFSLKVLNMF